MAKSSVREQMGIGSTNTEYIMVWSLPQKGQASPNVIYNKQGADPNQRAHEVYKNFPPPSSISCVVEREIQTLCGVSTVPTPKRPLTVQLGTCSPL